MYEELKEFGLSDNESEVYVALLKAGTATANKIAKITGIKRSTTYDNLNLLINKGLVSMITKDNVHLYEAAEPKKINRILQERKDKISRIIPQLQSLKETAKSKAGVTFYEGKKGVITILNDILDEKKPLLFYGSRKTALVALQNYPENFIQKRADSKIPLRAVLALEDKGDPTYKDRKIKKYSKTKFLKELNKINTQVFIYSDKVAFMNSGSSLSGLIAKDKSLVEHQKLIFNMLWKKAAR